jgi:hypothetical protein
LVIRPFVIRPFVFRPYVGESHHRHHQQFHFPFSSSLEERVLWATKKGCQQENFQNLKSLTQLGALATQNYYKIGHLTYAPILRILQKMPIFSEIIIFGGNHAF